MEQIKISIILPVYNSEKTLSRAIESILSQTYKNFELIIVNDGSTDTSKTICENYVQKCEQIKYIETKNEGVSNARNIGIKESTGRYIMFIDADDEYYKNTLFDIASELREENEWILFSYKIIHTNTKKEKIIKNNNIKLYQGKKKNIFIEQMQQNELFNQIWNKVYNAKILKQNKILFDVKSSLGEDLKFNLQYIDKINNAIYIDKVLYKYYSSDDGLNLKNRPEKIYIKLNNLKEQKNFYNKMGYSLEYVDVNYIYTCLSGLTSMIDKKDKDKTKMYLKQYIENEEIKKELKRIKKERKALKIKLVTNILLTRNVVLLQIIAKALSTMRDIYRKIKLG